MMGKQHVLFGTMTSIALYVSFYKLGVREDLILYPGIALSTAVFGSLLPDIDRPSSTIGRVFPIVSNFFHRHGGHRGITHDLFLALVLAVISIIKVPLSIWFWMGYLGHLFLDALTMNGVSWMFLLYGRKYSRDKMDLLGLGQGVVHLLPYRMRVESASGKAQTATFISIIVMCLLMFTYVKYNPVIIERIKTMIN